MKRKNKTPKTSLIRGASTLFTFGVGGRADTSSALGISSPHQSYATLEGFCKITRHGVEPS